MKVICPSCLSVNNIPKKDEYKKANCGKCKSSLLDTKPMDLNSISFDEVVVNSDIPVIVDFWAPWCGPCKMMAPTFTSVASKFPLKAHFVKVNTQDDQTLGSRFGIRSIPTIVVFKDGIEVQRISGALNENDLTNLVNSCL
jgi:thioredoxin 2